MLSELFWPYLYGGAERRYYEIVKRLAAKGHEVTVYSLGFPGHYKEEFHEGVRIRRIGSHPMMSRNIYRLPYYIPALFHSFNHEYDIIDANQGIASFAGIWNLFGLKRPIVATFHDVYWNAWNEHFGWPGSLIGKTMDLTVTKLPFTSIIANSKQTARKLQRIGCKSRIETIVSGIDFDFISGIESAKISNTITYVGRLERYKNVDLLINAVANSKTLKKYILLIIGTGSEENNLRRLASDLGVNAIFAGFVDESKKISLIKGSDILVNPSTVEGLGLILIEAMACGTPVIGFDLDCYKEFCNPHNSNIISKDADLGDAIQKVLSKKTRNKAGIETAKRFSWDSVADQVEKLYLELISERL